MITLRPARESDRAILLEWRNDPETRAASIHGDEVAPDEHDAWFSRQLVDPDRILYLGELDGERIGMVRFDRDRREAEVSINLNPDFRGKGLSRQLLAASIVHLHQDTLADIALIAKIREDNLPSLKIFADLGFSATGSHEGEFAVFRREPSPVADAELGG